MRNLFLLLFFLFGLGETILAVAPTVMNEPDSAYIFAYATDKNEGRNGLHFAWSRDAQDWQAIGPEHSYVRCDYGRWGLEKRMVKPIVFAGKDGRWHCLWRLNESDERVAHAASGDLAFWWRQSYLSLSDLENQLGQEAPFPLSQWERQYQTALISGKEETGSCHKVAWALIDGLIQSQQLAAFKAMQNGETTKDDAIRFAGLKPVEAKITVDPTQAHEISDLFIGIFFEDINYAADGGLYAELIQNRDFEYDPMDKEGRDPNWNHQTAWQLHGGGASWTIEATDPIHENNKHYALLNVETVGAVFTNDGFDGICLKAGEKYDLSLFARMPNRKGGKLTIRLMEAGKVIAETKVSVSNPWKKVQAVLTAKETCTNARLEVIPQMAGVYALDMISLFPQKTFKGRKNGLRADLAQTLADIKPRFVRFPGGCVAHGDGLHNMYRWKNTIGPLEARVPQRNLWGYHQTAGLGYYEYFQFCEDLGAEPVPVLAAGVPCQNSAHQHGVAGGQQGGIPMCEMENYIQEIFDLIEWANGDAQTVWGKKRAEAGHPKPFNLKYLGIGNEDQITDVFEERFEMIYKAVKEKYPEIVVIGTVGPFYEGTDYEEGWKIASRLDVPIVDEHYYNPPGWFIHNQDYYDRYDRTKSKVYLGEYAAHLPGRPVNIETALAEALFLTAVERNADIVPMTSYAPLLAKEGHTQWNPDLIYFNNTEVKPTVGYYVQQLYGQNAGNHYLPSRIDLSDRRDGVRKRIGVSVVRDEETNDVIIKLVNLLPVAVKTTLQLEGITPAGTQVVRTVLTGTPDDKQARPVTTQCPVESAFNPELPAYSFSVYRIKTQ
ncbi:alpha-L-arabinofuranosidase C-terminal domain-containing protein [Parabacteroides sp. PF5-6]|uniref:alpha-L-arabinofuranosidase C-terminal domain-containing protein n=1 Tax=Parabacteroides sp. PF5-6 TaxID=1742403 RepID=UPI00240538E9|nr:alpha-L-arabinofuranosidase C-terminal domain-containing protein [Parabacteroides sp. PF5-6]MDF9829781.1 alpha-L-arabinofuranosidase [Parabacteroides sp. PF5-6]